MEKETATAEYRSAAEAIIQGYGRDPDFIISMLQDLQRDFGYLPPQAMKAMSEILQVPLSQFYAIATFYSSFRLAPRGQHLITLCMGTVCFLKGAGEIRQSLQQRLNVEPGGTTEDGLFTFQPVNCLGACALAPVMVIDEQYYDKVKLRHVSDILAKYRSGEDKP